MSKTCSRCGAEKPLDDFYRSSNTSTGRQSRCIDCCKEVKKEKWADPVEREKNQKQFREWAQQNKALLNERQKERARANPEPNRERVKKWREENPERARENARRQKVIRREREQAAKTGKRVSKVKAWEDQGGICPCGEPIDRSLKYPDPMSPSLDHITPLARGGKHEQSNIQWMHVRCNVIKGASYGHR